MKIALLWPDYWPYIRRGTERMVHDIAVYLAGRVHEVHILASKPGPGAVERCGPITVRRLPRLDHPLLRRYRLIGRFDVHALLTFPHLLRERYDLVHMFFYSYGPGVRLARRLRGTRAVFHVVMIPPYWPRAFDPQLFRLCLQPGVPVRVFSRFCARHVEQHYGLETCVIPPTVDIDVFRPQETKDLSRPKILYTADLAAVPKGPRVLALAFNKIHQARPDAVLQLAGPIGFNFKGVRALLDLVEPEARGSIAQLGPVKSLFELIGPAARPSVEVLGPGSLQNLPRLYAKAAVTVLPSLDEPFGMVLTESMACGTAVVGTNSGGIPEIITDPAVGTLFERTDDLQESADNLATAVLRTLELAQDPGTAERCRRHASQWTWDSVGERFDAFQDLALGRARNE